MALTEPKQPPRIRESASKGRVNSGSGSVRVDGDDWFGKSEAFCGENSPDFESRQRFVLLCPSLPIRCVSLFVLLKKC